MVDENIDRMIIINILHALLLLRTIILILITILNQMVDEILANSSLDRIDRIERLESVLAAATHHTLVQVGGDSCHDDVCHDNDDDG